MLFPTVLHFFHRPPPPPPSGAGQLGPCRRHGIGRRTGGLSGTIVAQWGDRGAAPAPTVVRAHHTVLGETAGEPAVRAAQRLEGRDSDAEALDWSV